MNTTNTHLAFERGRHAEVELAINKLERELEFEQLSIESHLERLKERKFTLYNNVRQMTENEQSYNTNAADDDRYSTDGVF
jgi:hypothetical protein